MVLKKVLGVSFLFIVYALIFSQQMMGEIEPSYITKTLTTTHLNQWVTTGMFSSDDKMFLVAHARTVTLFNTATGKDILQLTGHKDIVWDAAFSPDSKNIITASGDTTAILWNTATGNIIQRFKAHTGGIRAVAYSPDGKTILTGSDDSTAKFWDIESGRVLRTFQEHKSGIKSVAFSPDGKSILTGAGFQDGTMKLWDIETGSILQTFPGEKNSPVNQVAFAPNGKFALMALGGGLVKLFNLASTTPIKTFDSKAGVVCCAAFSPDSQQIIAGTMDPHSAILWDIEKGNILHTFKSAPQGIEGTVTSVAFSHDGKKLLTAHHYSTAKLWDVATRTLILSVGKN